MRKVSLSTFMGVSIALLMSIMLIVVQLIHFNVSVKNTFELLRDTVQDVAMQMEQSVKQHLEPSENLIEHLSLEIIDENGEILEKNRLKDIFSGGLVNQKYISSINLFYKDYSVFGVLPDKRGKAVISPLSFSSKEDVKSHSDIERLYKENATRKNFFWNEPKYFLDKAFLVLTKPLYAKNKYKGFLSITLDVQELSHIMYFLKKRYQATTFILKGKQKVLAHPLLRQTHPSQSVQNPLPSLHELGDEVLKEIWTAQSGREDLQALHSKDISLSSIERGEEGYIYLTKKIYGYGHEPLILGAWINEEVNNTQLVRLETSMFVGIGMILIGVLFVILLSKHISKPVKRYAKATKKIGQLNIEDVEKLPRSHYKEIDEQAVAFNKMLDVLRVFGKYVPIKLVNKLMHQKEIINSLSQRKILSIMFTDIIGFTTLSERLKEDEIALLLNEHFEILGESVEKYDGTIDKYIGDALMAFWGAPEVMEDTPNKACKAALAMKKSIEVYNQTAKEKIRIRVGIHTGPTIVGNIGSTGRINYTIVGDSVNVTQRIESLGREYIGETESVCILISEETRKGLDKSFVTEQLGEHLIKGRQQYMKVYKLLRRES